MFEDLEPLLRDLARRDLAFVAGDGIFHQGDPVRQVYFLTDGAVHLLRHQETGAPLVLQRAGPGGILAEASLYSERYHCDATAVTGAKLFAVSKKRLVERIAQRPDSALALMRRLAHELQNARFHAELLAMKTVAARLDGWVGWRGALPAKGQWAGLAAELGVSPEALYREIARRQRVGTSKGAR